MQIAGSRCAICGQNVGTMREGAGCVTCDVVVHKVCAAVCPKCSQHFLQGEQIQALPSPAEQTKRDRPKSVTVLARLTFVGVPLGAVYAMVGFVLLASEPSVGLARIVGGVITAILSGVLGSAFLRGLEWSRMLYLWASPLLFAAGFAMGSERQPQFRWWRFAIGAGSYCIWAFMLTRPKVVDFFKRSQGKSTVAA